MAVSSQLMLVKEYMLTKLKEDVDRFSEPANFSSPRVYIGELEKIAKRIDQLIRLAQNQSNPYPDDQSKIIEYLGEEKKFLLSFKPRFVKAQSEIVREDYVKHLKCLSSCKDPHHMDKHIERMAHEQAFLKTHAGADQTLKEFISKHRALLDRTEKRAEDIKSKMPAPKEAAKEGLALVKVASYPSEVLPVAPAVPSADGTFPVVQTPPGKYIKP